MADLPLLTRRAFIGSSAASLATLLAACSRGNVATTLTTTTTVAATTTTTLLPPADRWAALAELRQAMRQSPDHFPARAQALIETGDADGILNLVRSLATYPAGDRSSSDLRDGSRWGWRTTLRGGAGTPREKAELLAELYRQAGWDSRVVGLDIEIDQSALFVRPEKPEFAPGITDERLVLVRAALGLPSEIVTIEPLDPQGKASAALADSILGLFSPALATSDNFEFSNNRSLPAVVVDTGDGEQLANLWSADSLSPQEGALSTLDEVVLEPVQIELAIVTSTRPEELQVVASGSFLPSDLGGRFLSAKFIPAVNSIEELMRTVPREVTTFVPGLILRGLDIPLEESQKLSVRGTPFTIAGSLIDIDGNGPLSVEGNDLEADGDPTDVASLEVVSVAPGGFPTVQLAVNALASDGSLVEGLPAEGFAVLEGGEEVSLLLTRNVAPDPRVLFLLDTSSSLPPEFLGEGAANVVREIAGQLSTENPGAEFAVAACSFEEAELVGDWSDDPELAAANAAAAVGYSSILWEALISAQKLGPTAIVFITDAAALDLNEVPLTAVPADRFAQVELGPPTVIVGVGTVDQLQFDAMASAGRSPGVLASDPAAAVSAVSAVIRANPLPSYLLTLLVPEEGPNTRDLDLTVGSASTSTSYQVPPRESRVTPPSLVGLHLTVRHQGQAVRRRLAGIDPERRAQFSPDTVAEVRSALFGSYVIEFEGAAPPASVLYDDLLNNQLVNRTVSEATDSEALKEALAEGDFFAVPWAARSLSVPLPDIGDGPLTYETGLRMILHHQRNIPVNAETSRSRKGFDILPFTSFRTADADGERAFATTARRSARLALAEARIASESTLSSLEGEPLVTLGFSVFDLYPPEVAQPVAAALIPWDDFRLDAALPESGTPVAAWGMERSSGSFWGILGDSTGGGAEEDDINDTFDAASDLLEGAGFASDLAGMMGMPSFGFAGGVWLSLEQTKLEKLRAATLMLASMRPPRGDIADLGDLGCDLARAAAGEAAGRAAGGILGEAAGDLVGMVDSGASAAETATGGGPCG